MSFQAISETTTSMVQWAIKQTGSDLLGRVYRSAERIFGETATAFGSLAAVGSAIYFAARWISSTQHAPAAPRAPEPLPRHFNIQEANRSLASEIRKTDPAPTPPTYAQVAAMSAEEADLYTSRQMAMLETHYHSIFENVYVGDSSTAEGLLRDNRADRLTEFMAIVSVSGVRSGDKFLPYEKIEGVHHISLAFDDSEEGVDALIANKDVIFDQIDLARQNNQKLLLHCTAGQSRSVGTMILYLVEKCEVTFDQAHNFVKTKRPNASTLEDSGFLRRIKAHCDGKPSEIEESDGIGAGVEAAMREGFKVG